MERITLKFIFYHTTKHFLSKKNRRESKKFSRKSSLEERGKRRVSVSNSSSTLTKQLSGSLNGLNRTYSERRKSRETNKLTKNRKIRSNENLDLLTLSNTTYKAKRLARQKSLSTSQDSLAFTNRYLSGSKEWVSDSPLDRSSSNSDLEDGDSTDCEEATATKR